MTFPITNAPKNLELQTWKSIMDKYGGPAKVARFVCMFHPCNLQQKDTTKATELTYMCEATEYPGRGFMSTDIRYYGPSFKAPFHTTYDDIVLNFLVRANFQEREFFDDWMNLIQPINEYNFRYRRDYATTIDMFQMADFGFDFDPNNAMANYKFTLDKAYPVLIAAQPVNWGDENFHRLSVTFTYQRWYRSIEETKTNKFKLVQQHMITDGGTYIPGNSFFAPG
jgi:hypothetical protein